MNDPAPKVPSPRRSDLEKLRSDLAKDVEALRSALTGPDADMAGGKVWVGKNARTWHRELGARHKRLKEQVDKLLPLLDAAIRDEPEKVSAADARAYHRSG